MKEVITHISKRLPGRRFLISRNVVLSTLLLYSAPIFGQSASIITPDRASLVVGETRSLKALGSNGQVLTGLTWTTSNSAIVRLSSDDPPVLTALTSGQATVSAGGANATITVYAVDLPQGAVIWSNSFPATRIVPAIPSTTGVADVFAFSGSTVAAFTSEGFQAWTAETGPNQPVPDFQGGLIGLEPVNDYDCRLVKFDGLTGQKRVLSTALVTCYGVAIHPDGTVIAFSKPSEGNQFGIVGVNSVTGNQLLRDAAPRK